ncbi:MAG TPA: hypothetical protein VFA04_19245 [Bryobacteraceae bacterium]|nr:hypothetical protein [Bryobacteraceae bacterium]
MRGYIRWIAVALLLVPLRGREIDLLWRNPGNVARLDLADGPGGRAGRPKPPFRFVAEDVSGTSPKVTVQDSAGRKWSVKWGKEAWPSTFSSHLAWACGYFAETEYFVARGRIFGAHDLRRARDEIAPDGTFEDARFQLRSSSPKFLKDRNWAWNDNPFLGTHEFNGLRILMMLLSNWDAKDERQFRQRWYEKVVDPHGKAADSNLAIFEERGNPPRYLFFVSDWGATMGKASNLAGRRDKWNARHFTRQTAAFVRGVDDNGQVEFSFRGKNGRDISQGITVSDVRWLMHYLGRISDAQITRALVASGATPDQVSFFGPALRQRIRELQAVANTRPRQIREAALR